MKVERASGRGGLSFLHLILLLTSLTGFAIIGIPAWFGRGEVTLENATRLLVRDLNEAQDRAAFRNGLLRAAFFEDGDGYAIVDEQGNPISAPVGDGPFQRRYSRDAVFRGVRIEEVEVGPGNALHFGPRGRVLHGGRLVLTFDGQRREVRVEASTGDVSIDGAPAPRGG